MKAVKHNIISRPTLVRINYFNLLYQGEPLDIEIYEERNKNLDVNIAPLTWAKEWPPQVNGSTGVKQTRVAGSLLPPFPPTSNGLATDGDMNNNSYDGTGVRNSDMFLLGAAPNSVFFASNDNIEEGTGSTNLLSAAEPTSNNLTLSTI